MTYAPPKAGQPGMPVQVDKADFRLQNAGGTVAFDPARGRVAAEEQFHVRGTLPSPAWGRLPAWRWRKPNSSGSASWTVPPLPSSRPSSHGPAACSATRTPPILP
jgi:hypothetical protein